MKPQSIAIALTMDSQFVHQVEKKLRMMLFSIGVNSAQTPLP